MGLDPFTIAAGSSLLGGVLGSSATRSAAKTQAGAADRATRLQREMYDETVTRNEPFVQGGSLAFNALLDRLGVSGNTGAAGYGSLGGMPTAQQVIQEPGYEFGRSEGLKALTNALNAKGMSYSGAALKAATRYGNDYASGQYGNAFNRMQGANQQNYNQLMGVTGVGQASANNSAAAGQQFGAQAGGNMMQGANALAANQLAQGNIWQNALNQTTSLYKNSQQTPGGSAFRYDDPYRNPLYFGGGEGE